MKIEYPNDTDITYNFVDLDLGDVFTEDDGECYYIKCVQLRLPSNPANTNNTPYVNAIDLENGMTLYFGDHKKVKKVDCTLSVRSFGKS